MVGAPFCKYGSWVGFGICVAFPMDSQECKNIERKERIEEASRREVGLQSPATTTNIELWTDAQ